MKVKKLNGTDNHMYMLIAPFAMNSKIIRQNGGYAFTTSENHIWYIAFINNKVAGFLSVNGNNIQNDYTDENLTVLKLLIENVITDSKENNVLKFVASENEVQLMESLGFIVERTSTNYFFMRYEHKEKV